jgi:hypothetical protein
MEQPNILLIMTDEERYECCLRVLCYRDRTLGIYHRWPQGWIRQPGFGASGPPTLQVRGSFCASAGGTQ